MITVKYEFDDFGRELRVFIFKETPSRSRVKPTNQMVLTAMTDTASWVPVDPVRPRCTFSLTSAEVRPFLEAMVAAAQEMGINAPPRSRHQENLEAAWSCLKKLHDLTGES